MHLVCHRFLLWNEQAILHPFNHIAQIRLARNHRWVSIVHPISKLCQVIYPQKRPILAFPYPLVLHQRVPIQRKASSGTAFGSYYVEVTRRSLHLGLTTRLKVYIRLFVTFSKHLLYLDRCHALSSLVLPSVVKSFRNVRLYLWNLLRSVWGRYLYWSSLSFYYLLLWFTA